MRVAVWYSNSDIRIEEKERPHPGPKEILLRVKACGICGSDVVEWYRKPRAPLVPGHELGADVEEVGSGIYGYKKGDRVVVMPKVPCGECKYCRAGHEAVCPSVTTRLPGCFAEFVLVPEAVVQRGTYLLPETVSYEQATFVEPLACAIRSQRLCGLKPGDSLVVMGSGMSGQLQIRLAASRGIRTVATDLHPWRLDLAQRSGALCALDAKDNVPRKVMEILGGKADVVMLCTGALPAIEQAWALVDRGGAVVFFAVPGPEHPVSIPMTEFWTQEIRILTAYYCGPDDVREALELIAAGAVRVDDLITHQIPLSDIARGYSLVLDGKEALKVLVKPEME